MDLIKSELIELKKLILEEAKKPKNIAIIIGGLGASYFAYFTVDLYLKRKKYRHIPGPPPRGGILGFYLGNLSEIQTAIKGGKLFPELCVEWQKKYGPVFKVQFFNRIMVITADPNLTKEALIVKNYPKIKAGAEHIRFPFGERFLGYGLLTELDQDKWKYRRAIFNPGFHRHVLITFIGQFNQITNSLSEKFRTIADDKTVVNLFKEINRATLDAIALIAFGMNVDAVNQTDSTLNSYLSYVLKTTMAAVLDPFMRYKPSKFHEIKEYKKILRYLRKLGREKIVERINAFQNNEHLPDDILSSILKSNKSGELDLEEMVDDFITFFVAGQETTANALAFCFLEMGKNPEIVKKAREEIDRVLGERTDVTYQDVTDLKYCTAIFKESLRLYPPAHMVAREIKDSITVNGVEIPKDTNVFISIFVNGRNEKYFKNPMEFNPDRFMKQTGTDSDIENYVYMPFSLGPRNCIGQTFAQLEGVVVIAKLVQKFDFKLDPTQSYALEQALTLRPKDGTRCFLTLRS